MRFTVFALLGLGACGASRSRSYTCYVDPGMSPAKQEATLWALASWEQAVERAEGPGRLTIRPIIEGCDDVGWHSFCVSAVARATVEGQCRDAGAVGCTLPDPWADTARILIAEDLPDEPGLVHAIGHEVGHAMGLKHTGAGTLMCGDTRCQPDAPTAADVAQYESLR